MWRRPVGTVKREFTVSYKSPKDPRLPRTRRLIKRIGRRGSFLLFLAILDVLYGYSLSFPRPSVQNVDLFLSSHVWGIIWTLVGIVCFFQAFAKVDRFGFTCAVTLKVVWAAAAFASWIFTNTYQYGWVSGVIFATFAMVTAIISYWPEPRRYTARDFE